MHRGWVFRLIGEVSVAASSGVNAMVNIYVGNLPYNATSAELETAFGAYGTVDRAQVVIERDTGRSRGFGFVEMPDEQDARAAMEALNGSDMGGRKLVVNEARPRR